MTLSYNFSDAITQSPYSQNSAKQEVILSAHIGVKH